jgi:hypothetical protein
MNSKPHAEKVTVTTFADKRRKGQAIAVLTAYDYMTARLLDACCAPGSSSVHQLCLAKWRGSALRRHQERHCGFAQCRHPYRT